MKKSFLSILLVFIFGLLVTGCSTSSYIQRIDDSIPIPYTSKFMVSKVIDQTRFKGEPGSTEANFDIGKELEIRVLDELEKEQIRGDDFKLSIEIIEYAPGNAFGRWLMPGVGATRLSAVCEVQTKEGKPLYKTTVNSGVYAGGAYTIGAWKSIFGTVAKEIVRIVKTQMAPNPEQSEQTTEKKE